ncbi:zinc ion binding protein-like protein [Mytilinidion resinicola]|uniref:Zinc ion binding protein-like protein n=1 Tax=Mytilinidion resinicola TaxID=574789 RepID=A0A6A6YDF6_9PEZI|nr:zinc ion binding protein-like protein [Mytilinidion resinicola]KAF2806629.1 zinc ion binding protein-like protein [Mytilinidion resinicola]
MREIDSHFDAYEHMKHLPREQEALIMLRKAASAAKPMMRKRGWKVGTLAEFLPDTENLLGLNVNKTERILLRLRYHHDSRQFLPLEQVIDTLLHELSHIIWGPHDQNFQNCWNELRDEHQSLLAKGYTGEGFLGQGKKLGGKRVPLTEMRRQARAAAEKRRSISAITAGSGRKLGGSPVTPGVDMRKVIADAAARRNSITEGCASGSKEAGKLSTDASKVGFRTKAEEDDANDRAIAQALRELMEEEEMTRLDELYAPSGAGGLAWDRENGLSFDDLSQPQSPGLSWNKEKGLILDHPNPPNRNSRPVSRLLTENPGPFRTPSSSTTSSANRASRPPSRLISEDEEQRRRSKALPSIPAFEQPLEPVPSSDPDKWACPQCTLLNHLNFLSCEACGLEQPPQPIPRNKRYGPAQRPPLPKAPPAASLRGPGATPFEPAKGRIGWNCLNCGTFMENQWWTCSLCGTMKAES